MLDERIETIRVAYGLEKSDFWELPQKKGTWLVKHAALEVVAAKAGIEFLMPQVLEAHSADGLAAICVEGRLKDRSEWSIGEASPKNSKNAYPWAMAEKRAKDRVILKLVGIHGLVYSEDEMSDAPARPDPTDDPDPMPNTSARQHFKPIYDEITACTTLKQLQGAWERHQPVFKLLPEAMQTQLIERKDEMKELLSEQAAAKKSGTKPINAYNFDALEPETANGH